jgi:hypothetical protein
MRNLHTRVGSAEALMTSAQQVLRQLATTRLSTISGKPACNDAIT